MSRVKNYFDLELRTTLINAAIGGVAGYIAFLINEPLTNLVLALAVLTATSFILKKIWKIQKGRKWWISNAIVIFIFVWLVVWTIFYNTKII